MRDLVLDYSAHSAWDYCPAKWFELYCNRRSKRWPAYLRDDALALGSLVHGGMEIWQQTGTIGIPQSVMDEVCPTPACFQLAQELIWGYTRAYPKEHWPLLVCEEPVLFPLRPASGNWRCSDQEKCKSIAYWSGMSYVREPVCLRCGELTLEEVTRDSITGLAKIDTYFYVPEVTTIPGGLDGQEITLNPGWWIHEYKTKSPYISAALYMQSWETGLQASYQTLALQHKLNARGEVPEVMQMLDRYGHASTEVQGILINVMEKPRRHIPKRTCKGCKEQSEFASWLPTGTGDYQCPLCGNRQALTPLKEAPVQTPPVYYRVLVQRGATQLARDREIMVQTGQRMLEMRAGGLQSVPWNKGNCVNFQWKKACDYFQPHLSGRDTREDGDYETRKDYRGLVQIAE